MSIFHSHAEVQKLKNRIEQLSNENAELKAELAKSREDTKLLNYREHKWKAGWKLPMTLADGTKRVFAEPTYRQSLRRHMQADE